MEAIILAGGFGTRLQNKLGNIPKPMAPINNRPFLDYLLDYLIKRKVKRVILSVYYQYQIIKNHYDDCYRNINILYSIDTEELGTGGAVKDALLMADDNHVFVINGDTYFDVNLSHLYKEHIVNNNEITLSLKPMKNFDRYGIVETDSNAKVLSLKEKQYCDYGKIDGGIYLVKRNIFNSIKNKNKFSFNDFIMRNLNNIKVGSLLCDEIFIDIGTSEDYDRAHLILENR
jgi:D-glycero-alpha-D-manno-heptose 1-phosphate guanylyltransferase